MGTTIRCASHEEWLKAREGGIGSSEAATVLGVNPFDSAYMLWRRKTGRETGHAETFVMKAGHYLEDAVARFFADETGAMIVKNSAEEFVVYDDNNPILRVSPDRYYYPKNYKRNAVNRRILECKTTQKAVDDDNIPKHWFVQLQYQMGVCGVRHGALAWLTQGHSFGYKEIAFDKEFYTFIVERVTAFYEEHVVKDVEPPVFTQEDVAVRYAQGVEGKIVDGTYDDAKLIKQAKMLREEIKCRDDELKGITMRLKQKMQDAEVLTIGGDVYCTWKTGKEREVFDTKAFAAEHPELYKQYLDKRQGTRTFLYK